MSEQTHEYIRVPVVADWGAKFDPASETGTNRRFISQESMSCEFIKPNKALYSRSEMLKILGFFVGAAIVISAGSSTSLFGGNIDHTSIESLASEIEGLTHKLKETDTHKLFDEYQNAAIELAWARQEIADLKEADAEHRSDDDEQVHKLSHLLVKEHEENLRIRGETDETISKLLAEIDEDDAELQRSSIQLLEMAKAKVSSEKTALHQTEVIARQLQKKTQEIEDLAKGKSGSMAADEWRAVKEEATNLEEKESLRERNIELQQKLHEAMMSMSRLGDADHLKQAKKLRGDVDNILQKFQTGIFRGGDIVEVVRDGGEICPGAVVRVQGHPGSEIYDVLLFHPPLRLSNVTHDNISEYHPYSENEEAVCPGEIECTVMHFKPYHEDPRNFILGTYSVQIQTNFDREFPARMMHR